MLTAMQKPKRPRDANALARAIVGIATGEIDDAPPPDTRDPAAVALGRKGGQARAASMTKEARRRAAKKAAKQRWRRHQMEPAD